MKSDETVDTETLHQHGWEGIKKKRNYKLTLYLSMAHKVELAQWMECYCSKCSYYRSPTWRANQSDDMTCASLAPKRFYRRGRGKVCVSDRIYNKPWKK
ncbi:hypothetical protein GQ600_1617 [Phytophthora cactorum]|nr:hypothetical protein GQ600_1617 [Phytophthora cactorum]